jgi:hypothetical protein
MNKERKPIQRQYVEFMGQWIAGAVVGKIIANVVLAGIGLYLVYRFLTMP